MNFFKIEGYLIDIINKKIFPGEITVENGKITDIQEFERTDFNQYIIPGFIDSHIHIESSMLAPSEFGRTVCIHGTVATVSDPHEIANVLGIEGINFMLINSKKSPVKIYFGVPSCVPATNFESSGAKLSAQDIEKLLAQDDFHFLSEMMNFPGVIYDDPDVYAKLNAAKKFNKKIDGHSPGLKGNNLSKYINAGISTDHECFELDEALEKIDKGMKILIRNGSAAKNFDTLHPLIKSHNSSVMFCSDDLHPDDLCNGHINLLVKKAINLGYDLFDVLNAATLNPIKHYELNVGLIQKGDPADFIIVNNLKDFKVERTYINGQLVAENGLPYIEHIQVDTPNIINCTFKDIEDFKVQPTGKSIRVIEAIDGQLITNSSIHPALITKDNVISDVRNDILKIAVVNRYKNEKPAIGFIKNFGLKYGAIATSVAHDSHNIIAVGCDDNSITEAVNLIIKNKGGMCVVGPNENLILPLPIAGLMSDSSAYIISQKYSLLNSQVLQLGSRLKAPFMTLSFMALLVIPKLKLSDKGLFDGEKFEFVDLFNEN